MKLLENLVEFSNRYGKRNDLVLAGGGNTSAKDDEVRYVKGSGFSLAEIKADGFVKMDRKKLAEIFDKKYPENDKEREAAALADLMDARFETELSKRPSVETTLHGLFPQSYVLHLHPTLVNGLTCGKDGEKIAEKLFGNDALWIGLCKPGYILAKLCKDKMDEYKSKYSKDVSVLILQNHGLFVAANDVDELDRLLNIVLDKLNEEVIRQPDISSVEYDTESADSFIYELKKCLPDGTETVFECNKEILRYITDKENVKVLMKPFTPDHIVYCKANPLYVENVEEIAVKVSEYNMKYGYLPKVFIIKNVGFIGAGDNMKQALTAVQLFNDALKIAVYSESFGGALHMTDELTDFIVNWEVESYRQKQN